MPVPQPTGVATLLIVANGLIKFGLLAETGVNCLGQEFRLSERIRNPGGIDRIMMTPSVADQGPAGTGGLPEKIGLVPGADPRAFPFARRESLEEVRHHFTKFAHEVALDIGGELVVVVNRHINYDEGQV